MSRRIEKTFQYPVWDEWRVNSFKEGRQGTFTYKGPEFLTVEVCNDPKEENYGKECGWCMWEKADLERPTGADIMRITVDCRENPLLCEILNDEGREDMVLHRRSREWKVLYEGPEGYPDVEYTDEVEPMDIYDDNDISYDFEKNEWKIAVRDWTQTGVDMNLTWQQVRDVRDGHLHETDAKVGMTDAPEELQDAWKDYRQKLRDLPAKMEAKGYTPWQAVQMFPIMPKDMRDPEESSDPNDPYRDGAFPNDIKIAAQKAAGKK
jgi:hypothetical protein|tara:strand:- start:10350 stop:11141 length:792 start_codon:yes stop_codon:yes gene_type:complete